MKGMGMMAFGLTLNIMNEKHLKYAQFWFEKSNVYAEVSSIFRSSMQKQSALLTQPLFPLSSPTANRPQSRLLQLLLGSKLVSVSAFLLPCS